MREVRSDPQRQLPLDNLIDVGLKHLDNRITAAQNQPLNQALAKVTLNPRSAPK